MLWFCVELPDLGLEVCARRVLDQDVPVVLVQDNRVVARNVIANDSGIALGSSLATAHSICHRLVHFPRDIAAEHDRLRFLADAAYRFSASISIHQPSAILLEVSGSLKLFGGLHGLKRRLINLLGELGHRADIGIAHTPLAALAFARANENCELPRWPAADEVKARASKILQRISLRHTECETDPDQRFSIWASRPGDIQICRRNSTSFWAKAARLSGTPVGPAAGPTESYHSHHELRGRTPLSRKHFQ
jgi:protein ImuB